MPLNLEALAVEADKRSRILTPQSIAVTYADCNASFPMSDQLQIRGEGIHRAISKREGKAPAEPLNLVIL